MAAVEEEVRLGVVIISDCIEWDMRISLPGGVELGWAIAPALVIL